MRAFLAVARREIEEKWFVFPAALVASLVPFAIPLIRGMHGAAAAEIREWSAFGGALMFAGGLAAALGATTIAGELAERRIGFYFSRPISGVALWAGHLGAACFMALGVAVLVSAPTLIAAKGRVILWDHPAQALGLLVIGVAAVVLLFHAGAIALRPRTPLLALDAAALVLVGLAAVALNQRFVMAYAVEAHERAEIALTVVAFAALVSAGLLAVTRGRSDSRAAHRTLSATLWSILASGLALTAGYAGWVFSVAPKDFAYIDDVTPADKGSWVKLRITARGWQPVFLYDTATGRYQRTGGSWREPVLSHDGTRAAWFEPSAQGGPYDVVTWKLDEPSAKPVHTFSLPSIPYTAFLSDNGERLATIAGGVLSVWDPAARASLGSARVAGELSYLIGFFVDRNRVRILRFKNRWDTLEENSLDILEFDLSTKTLSTVVTLADASSCMGDETGDRLLVLGKNQLTLRDGHTGAQIAALSERSTQRRVTGRFTSEGHIAVRVTEFDSRQLRDRRAYIEVFTRDGRLERTLSLPGLEFLWLGGEVAPGQFVVSVPRDSNGAVRRVIYLATLATGEMRQVAEGLHPVGAFSEAGSEGTRLFEETGRSLVHFDALTGERRVILGKPEKP